MLRVLGDLAWISSETRDSGGCKWIVNYRNYFECMWSSSVAARWFKRDWAIKLRSFVTVCVVNERSISWPCNRLTSAGTTCQMRECSAKGQHVESREANWRSKLHAVSSVIIVTYFVWTGKSGKSNSEFWYTTAWLKLNRTD